MKLHARWLPVSLILLLLEVAGCASLPPRPGDSIGILRVSGPNVWLNNAPANDGEPVRIGSSLATGPGSSALLEFRDGGYLQLDENTDPIFEWLEQSKCILIRIFKGQAYLKRERACVEGPNLSLVLNSEVNLRIQARPGVSEVTLLRGRADVSAPTPITLLPGQQFVASERRITALRTLSPAELRSIVAWRGEFRFRPLPVPQPEGPTIWFPPRRPPRRPDPGQPPGQPPKPEPGRTHPTEPSGTKPVLDRLRVPPGMIERQPEPVIR
ncbi:MAG: hypothetical protein A2075_05650 [Geobacteraceae bacterium GWC2_58_44]|nr:MAG: hypothetical protein A2075_05650 [Geobacteraceae bacterium GWC2_58_44]HBG06391.1 hypothetical protein [Geobacter sp.]